MSTRPDPLDIRADDLTGPEVHALLEEHLAEMYATSPPESVHALDLDALRGPSISFFSAWKGDVLLGCGALKSLGEGHAEIKSMRTSEAARGQGVGSALLLRLLDEARALGITRVSLETGTEPFFEPARQLYLRHGFTECEPFADYVLDPNSIFLTRTLAG